MGSRDAPGTTRARLGLTAFGAIFGFDADAAGGPPTGDEPDEAVRTDGSDGDVRADGGADE